MRKTSSLFGDTLCWGGDLFPFIISSHYSIYGGHNRNLLNIIYVICFAKRTKVICALLMQNSSTILLKQTYCQLKFAKSFASVRENNRTNNLLKIIKTFRHYRQYQSDTIVVETFKFTFVSIFDQPIQKATIRTDF